MHGDFSSLESSALPQPMEFLHGEQLLQADEGAGDSRILVFATPPSVSVLRQSRTWVMDGCFSAAPQFMAQARCRSYVCNAPEHWVSGGTGPYIYLPWATTGVLHHRDH